MSCSGSQKVPRKGSLGGLFPEGAYYCWQVRPPRRVSYWGFASMRFNCVRLPYSLDVLLSNTSRVDSEEVFLAANPNLQGRAPVEIFDETVKATAKQNLTGLSLKTATSLN